MTQYVTAVGGFEDDGGAPGQASCYRAPAGQLHGEANGFTSSVLVSARTPTTTGTLFSAFDGGGWELRVNNSSGLGGLEVRGGVVLTSGEVSGAAILDLGRHGNSPFLMLTLVYDPAFPGAADGAVLLFVNAVSYSIAFGQPADVYVPPAAFRQTTIGARPIDPPVSAATAFILGCAYHPAALSRDQVFRHQLACLEAGAMIDGSLGGAFGAGIPVFDHLYDARRSNNGVGQSTFIAGLMGGTSVGQVPLAADVWNDLGAAANLVNFSRVDGAVLGRCFVTALKRIG